MSKGALDLELHASFATYLLHGTTVSLKVDSHLITDKRKQSWTTLYVQRSSELRHLGTMSLTPRSLALSFWPIAHLHIRPIAARQLCRKVIDSVILQAWACSLSSR